MFLLKALDFQLCSDGHEVLWLCRGLEWGGPVGGDIDVMAAGDVDEELVIWQEISSQ